MVSRNNVCGIAYTSFDSQLCASHTRTQRTRDTNTHIQHTRTHMHKQHTNTQTCLHKLSHTCIDSHTPHTPSHSPVESRTLRSIARGQQNKLVNQIKGTCSRHACQMQPRPPRGCVRHSRENQRYQNRHLHKNQGTAGYTECY